MTKDTRKTWYWTGGVTAGVLLLLLAALWWAGVFQATPVQ